MRHLPYLFLDAGGTLVFPDPDRVAALAKEEGFRIDPAGVYREHYRITFELDSYILEKRRFPQDSDVWTFGGYFESLFGGLGIPQTAAHDLGERAEEEHRRDSLWAFTYPWVPTALSALRESGYRMSVISNADGRAEQVLTRMGLAQFFERVLDSADVGVEKPEPEIFLGALNPLGLTSRDALYVGDVMYVDVWGANRVGMGAVHLDPAGLYRDWPGERISDISALPDWLDRYASQPDRLDLHPLRDFRLASGH
ncbi:MAG: HAD family hydrolase [Anaerolineae bacterium]